MNTKSPQDNSGEYQSNHPRSEKAPDEQDFFEKLQDKEAKEGSASRGKGHGWTTFIETILGDW